MTATNYGRGQVVFSKADVGVEEDVRSYPIWTSW